MSQIYVVDDDEQLLRMVGMMLERGGHKVTLINKPHDGLELVKKDPPDLLVVDVMMPGLSGHDIAREIRSTEPIKDLPILMLTARAQEVDRIAALKSGADDYLSKPVTSTELLEHIDSLLRKEAELPKPDKNVLITFYGFRGGVGKTTLAANLAAALRRMGRQDVCLVDFSFSGGQAAQHLRLKPQQSWADLPPANELTWGQLEAQFAHHASGLKLLSAPSIPQRPSALSTQKITTILDLLHSNVMFTILDLPATLNELVEVSLPRSFMALHVLRPEVVSVQTAVKSTTYLTQANLLPKYKSFILNQTNFEAQLSPQAVEKALNTRLTFQIGYDQNQIRGLAQGVPLTLTKAKSPLPTVVGKMAEAILQRVVSE